MIEKGIIKLEDELSTHKQELLTMVGVAAGEGKRPSGYIDAIEKLLLIGQMAMALLEEHHK